VTSGKEDIEVDPRSRPRVWAAVVVGIAGAVIGLCPTETAAQDDSDSLAPIHSLGLPGRFRPYVGGGVGVAAEGPGTRLLTRAMAGAARDLTNPVPGLIGVGAESWVGSLGTGPDIGLRLLLTSHAAGLQGGLDYSARLGHWDFVLTAFHPLHRGGVLLPGAGVRLDWIPARTSLTASLDVPILQPRPGRTRPRAVVVAPPPFPRTRRVAPETARRELSEAARRVATVVLPFLPGGDPARARAETRRLAVYSPAAGEIERYHATLDRAFVHALGSPNGEAAAENARRILLDELLIPFDRDLGRIRRPAVMRALGARAADAFARWLDRDSGIPARQQDAALGIFEALLAAAQETADTARAHWGDSRLVWLPLQLGLRPEQHDTQSELDSLLERITGSSFRPGNDLIYATDERFEPALQRSILDARRYHVLWVHDFAGDGIGGRPDSVSLQVVMAYLQGLTTAAWGFERTRRIPAYFIFVDRYYYLRTGGGRWLELLQDPLGHNFRLARRYRAVERRVRYAQSELRRAVRESAELQAEADRRGQRWLHQLIAVHVSATYPPDPSFLGPRVAGGQLTGVPDDLMRDHRKVAFADLTEADPSRGVALLTGLGIGEHYARYRWLDRTLVLRGPAAIALRTEARELLRSQGFGEREIPLPLRADAEPPDLAGRIATLQAEGWHARVAIAMNQPGYGPKRITAAKAALYTLMPPGSTIIAMDPQWLSRFWGGMLLGSALRGARVLIVGPGPENSAYEGAFPQWTLQRDLFERLITAREILAVPLTRAGGMLQLGLFRTGIGTNNVPGGVRGVRDGLRQHPFIREALPFDPNVWTLFEQADSLLLTLGESGPPDTLAFYHPRFHLKTQFFGTEAAMREALGRPEWREFFVTRIRERLHEPPAGTDIQLGHLEPIRGYLDGRGRTARERQALYLEVGSHNQDPRSFMLDGEAMCLVSGEAALVSAGDMLLLSTVGVDWLDDVPQLDRAFPSKPMPAVEAARAAEPLF